MKSTLYALCTLAVLHASALADVLVVDQANGPGTDFVVLQEAIDFAMPGDALLIRAGSYPGFYLDKGISLIGLGGVAVDEGSLVRWVDASQLVALADLNLLSLDLSNVDGTIVLSDLSADAAAELTSRQAFLRIEACADVRVLRMNVLLPPGEAARITNSRVEFTDAELRGRSGAYWLLDCSESLDSYGAVTAFRDSRVHLAACRVSGGYGGSIDYYYGSCSGNCEWGGDGSNAIRAGFGTSESGSEIFISGSPSDYVYGGTGGFGGGQTPYFTYCPYGTYNGSGAAAVALTRGSLHRSSVPLGCAVPGSACTAWALALGVGAVETMPAVPDPSFTLVAGNLQPGSTFQLRLRGEPGFLPYVYFGQRPALLDGSATTIERMTSEERLFQIAPTILASGEITRSFTVPTNWQPGRVLFFQAEVIDPSGAVAPARSNSLSIVVR